MIGLKHIPGPDDNIPGMLRTVRDKPVADPLGIKQGSELAQAIQLGNQDFFNNQDNQQQANTQQGGSDINFAPGVNTNQQTSTGTTTQTQTQPTTQNQPQQSGLGVGAGGRAIEQDRFQEQVDEGLMTQLDDPFTESTLLVPGSTAAEFIGMELGAGRLGDALGLNNAEQEREVIEDNQKALENMAQSQFAEAKASGNEQELQRARNTLNMISKINTDPYESVLSERPSKASVITDVATLVIGSLGAKGVINKATTNVGDDAARVLRNLTKGNKVSRAAGRAGNVTDNYAPGSKFLDKAAEWVGKGIENAPKYLREGLYGSTFDAYIRSNHPDATASDIVDGAERGLVWGVGTLAGLGGAGALLKNVSNKVRKPLKKGIEKLEKSAAKTLDNAPKDGGSVVNNVLSTIGEQRGMKEAAASSFLKTVSAARQFKTRLYDRYAPFKRVENKLKETLGRNLKEDEKLWRNLRLSNGIAASNAEQRFDDVANKLRPFEDVQDEGLAYATQLDYIDRAKLGQDVPGGKDLETLKDELRIMVGEIGDDMKRVGKFRRVLNGANTKSLERLRDSGLISQDEFDRILDAHPNYLPHNVIGKDSSEKIKEAISNSVDVSDNVLNDAVGSTKNIENPIAGMEKQIQAVEHAAHQNDIMKSFARLNESEDIVPGMKKVNSTDEVGEEFGHISFYEDGTKQIYQVPRDIAESVKGTPQNPGPITAGAIKLADGMAAIGQKKLANVLRGGATTYNPSFVVTNFPRDKQAAGILFDSMKQEMKDRYGTVGGDEFVQNLNADKLEELYNEYGIFGASIFKDGDDWVQQRMENTGMFNDITDKISSIPQATKKINEEGEKVVRMDAFKRALESGLSPGDAAMVARDVTIDFQKMGTAMKPLNKVIPFLNARVQGVANTVRGAKNAPHAYARNLMRWAGYPEMALYEWNSQFDSHDSLSPREKDNYWNIILGETEAPSNYNGEKMKVPHVVRIRKSEPQKLFSNPLRWMLEAQEGENYRAFAEMMGDTLGEMTPIAGTAIQGENLFLSTASQLGPGVSSVVGLAANKHPYFGDKIVPERLQDQPPLEQYTPDTPETSRKIAEQVSNIFNMDISPAKINFVLQSVGGGLSSDVQQGLDYAFGAWEGKLTEEAKKQAQSDTAFGYMAGFPVLDKVFTEPNEFYSEKSQFQREQTGEIKRKVNTRKLQQSRRISDIYETAIQKESDEARTQYIKSLNLSESELKDLAQERASRMSVDALDQSTDTEVRARVILNEIKEMKARGVGKDRGVQYIQKLQEEGILTPKTMQIINLLKQNPDQMFEGIPQRPDPNIDFSFLPTTDSENQDNTQQEPATTTTQQSQPQGGGSDINFAPGAGQ